MFVLLQDGGGLVEEFSRVLSMNYPQLIHGRCSVIRSVSYVEVSCANVDSVPVGTLGAPITQLQAKGPIFQA